MRRDPDRPSRRRLLRWLGGLSLGGLAGCLGGEETTGLSTATVTDTPASPTPTSDGTPRETLTGDWPAFQYDVQNRGHHPAVTGPTDGVDQRWAVRIGPGIRSSPAVVDGSVYVGSGRRLNARRLADGTERWAAELDGPVDASPTVADGLVYALSDAGTVYAVDAETGEVRWRQPTGQAIPDQPRTSSPTVAEGAVYVGLHRGGVGSFDASTGEERWRTRLEGAVIGAAPAVADGTLFTGDTQGALVAVDTADGAVRWRTPLAEFVTCPPAVHDDSVYVGAADGRVYEVEARSGSIERTFETEYDPDLPGSPLRKINASPAIADGRLFVGSNDYHAYAWDLATGERRWRFRVGGRCYTSPAVAAGVVYVGGIAGRLYGLDAASGEVRWSFETAGELRDSSAAVVNGALCIGDSAGRLYLLEASD